MCNKNTIHILHTSTSRINVKPPDCTCIFACQEVNILISNLQYSCISIFSSCILKKEKKKKEGKRGKEKKIIVHGNVVFLSQAQLSKHFDPDSQRLNQTVCSNHRAKQRLIRVASSRRRG